MHFYIWIFFIITIVTFADALVFMGPKHKFLCHCDQEQCYSTGICKDNLNCQKGYFGYACQYSNVFDYTKSTISELTDDSYDTCVTGRTNLEISFDYTKVRFLRLRVKDHEQYESLQFIFKTTDNCKRCDGSYVLPEPFVVEYHCQCLVKADGVFIINKNQIPICHIEISNGRNFALKAFVIAPPSSDRTYKVSGLVDGITDLQESSCYIGQEKFKILEVNIPVNLQILLGIVEIYDIPPDYESVREIKVEIISMENSKPTTSEVIDMYNLPVKNFILDEDVHTIQSVSIYANKTFGACEIKLIGDCPRGKYGLLCDVDCPNGCKWCTLGGLCIDKKANDCPRGKYGLSCDLDCPNGCNWCTTVGLCLDQKTNATSNECSPHCVDGICDDKRSCYIGCTLGFTGHDCKTKKNPIFATSAYGLGIVSYNPITGSLFKEGETIDFNCSTSSRVPVSLTWSWSYDLQNPTIINGTVLSSNPKYWSVLMYRATGLDNNREIICSSNDGAKMVKVKPTIVLPPTKPVIEGPDEGTSNTQHTWTCYSNGASHVAPNIYWRDGFGDFILHGVTKSTTTVTVPNDINVFNIKTTLTRQIPATETYTLECDVIHAFSRYMVEKKSQKRIKVLHFLHFNIAESKSALASKNGCIAIEFFVGSLSTVLIIIFTRLALDIIALTIF